MYFVNNIITIKHLLILLLILFIVILIFYDVLSNIMFNNKISNNGNKEGFSLPKNLDKTPTAVISLHSNALIKKIVISGYDYLHLSEFRLFDENGHEFLMFWGVDGEYSSNSQQLSGIDGFHKMFDANPMTYFHTASNIGPNNEPIIFTTTFYHPNGINLGNILIRNRYDCCNTRINNFVLKLYDVNNNVLASKPLTDPSLTNYQLPYTVTADNVAKLKYDIEQNHMNKNVILYKIARTEKNIFLKSTELVKQITLTGDNLLMISELKLYNTYGNVYKYKHDFTLSINTTPNFWQSSPKGDFTNLFDDDPISYFHSGDWKNVIFTVSFNNPTGVNLGKILIRNRYNLNHDLITYFKLNLYDVNNNSLLSNPIPLNDPSISNWREISYWTSENDGYGDRRSGTYIRMYNNIKQNHMNDNVITYVLCRPHSLLTLNKVSTVKKIVFKGMPHPLGLVLQLTELKIYNMEGQKLNDPYNNPSNPDFTIDINCTPKTWDNNNPGYAMKHLFDGDIVSMMHSGSWVGPNSTAVELTIIFNNPNGVNIGKIFIRNRMDCCWRRLNVFSLDLYDVNNILIANTPLTNPYLTSYPNFISEADHRTNHSNDNIMSYIVSSPDYTVSAASLTVGYNSVGITLNTNVYVYTMASIDNVHNLVISNYNFVAGETYLIRFTCYTNTEGAAAKMIFGYQSKPGNLYYKSPFITTTGYTYFSTITVTENGLLYIYIEAPGNSILYYTYFHVQLRGEIVTMKTSFPDFLGYTKSLDSDSGGNDLVSYANYTPYKCKDKCNQNSKCVGFVQSTNNLWGNTCWIKSNTASNKVQNNNNLILYEKGIKPITISPSVTIPRVTPVAYTGLSSENSYSRYKNL